MTERVLNYDRSATPQETYYWCGPASTQMILNSRGIVRSEKDLASEIGTTVNGTDYVGLIERVLNQYLPDAHYSSIYIENSPPTDDQKEFLWKRIVSSIDSGYGVAINIDVPPSNYPRGVKGSASPAYGSGEIFHYIAAMGYSDEGLRAVWIADSGFRPYGYWVALDQLITMIPPKGYAYANGQESDQDTVEAVMATNQEKFDAMHDKIMGYPGGWLPRGMFGPAAEASGGVDDTVGMLLNADGNAWNLVMIVGALLGVERDVQAIKDQAAGKFSPGSYVEGNAWLRKRSQEFAQKLLPLCGLLKADAFK